MAKIKVALVGVGNCASALVQGIHFYKNTDNGSNSIGLKNLYLGGYHPRDIDFVSAFDIDTRKVGNDLSEAISSKPNNTLKFADVPFSDVVVYKGPVLDGLGELSKKLVKIDRSSEADVAHKLKESNTEIVVNLLPGGATKASEWYAKEAIKAGCAFINATPTFIASDPTWMKRFQTAGLPVVGDDLKDQVGATILHNVLLKTLADRGLRITETYQLDVGGGTESLDTLGRTRHSKQIVKTKSVESALPYKASVVAGSTDYVDFLENRRNSYFWIKGVYFGGAPLKLDLMLTTVDAPNACSILLDVIRAVKIALVRQASGPIHSISAYFFKHPIQTTSLEKAEQMFEDFMCEKDSGASLTL
jgi:myo-inositol-1-phosphate synthase